MIKTNNLTKKYNHHFALDNLNIHVKEGDVYGFIGKNGAGKTTTINLLLSLIHKDSGEMFINGKEVVFNDREYKFDIGFVPDVPVFPSYLSAYEYLKYTLEVFNQIDENANQKILETLDFVQLKNTKKQISSYSRGMKQRLAIAQALIHNPKILIMDEPTSALDPIGRKEVMDIITKLKGKKTIFYSTHILEDVERVCDRIGLLDNGVLLIEDSIENIKDKYYEPKIFVKTESKNILLKEKLKKLEMVNNIELYLDGVVCKLNDSFNRNDLLKKLMEQNEMIVEVKRLETTLEDVFVKVTNENNH